MANMFSGKTDTQIPKTLSDCTKRDSTVANLHSWAERLENWGAALLLLLIIIGIVSTIIEGISIADIDEDLIFVTCLSSVIKWGIYAFIEYCVYHIFALLISALTSITQNTAVTANVALYEAAKNEANKSTGAVPVASQAAASSVLKNNEETKSNPNSSEVNKSHDKAKGNAPTLDAEGVFVDRTLEYMVVCPRCSTKQLSNRKVCYNCGVRFLDIESLEQK